MRDFNGKLAVVTGGASGVGFAIGEALAKQGARVVLTDIEQKSLENSAALLTSKSLDVYTKVADVSNLESMQKLASWCYLNMAQFIYFLITLELHLQNYCQFGIQSRTIGNGRMG